VFFEMPRRAARVTQADISRAIRAAKESGAGEVTIDADGRIHIALEKKSPGIQPDNQEDEPDWAMSGTRPP
jgi:hypothetical protein